MRLTLIGVGRLKAGPERELFARYFKRAADLGRAQGIAAVELREIDESRARRAEDRCAEEARAIRAAVPKGAWLTLLDERGAALTSRQWAEEIGRARDGGVARLCAGDRRTRRPRPDPQDGSARARQPSAP